MSRAPRWIRRKEAEKAARDKALGDRLSKFAMLVTSVDKPRKPPWPFCNYVKKLEEQTSKEEGGRRCLEP